MFSLRKRDNMQAFLLLFLLSEFLLLRLTSATTMTEPRQNTRVRISAFKDTIVFEFIRPHVDARLEGYILGYGSSMFSKQFIQLPADGQPYETELDAEPKYLVAVQSNKPEEPKKQCAGKVDLEKPLNLVIGSVTESSVLLSWGTLLASPLMDSVVEDCFDEGHFTVRYREKEPSNTWHYQTCPSTSTVIDNLKPDALYEFGVRADTDKNSGAWNAADQIIEPRELNQAKPKKPVLTGEQLFVPPVPVLKNIALTRTTPLLEHTDSPEPCKTSASTATESPTTSDNPHASTEPLPSTHTSIMSTPKTTSTVQPENPTSHTSTTQTDPLTEQHTSITPQQTTMTQPQPSTTQKLTLITTQTQTTTQEYTPKTQITVKDQPYTAKQQFSKTTSSPSPPTTKPQGTTSTVQEHPHPPKKQTTITQDTRKIHLSTRKQRLSTTQRFRGTSRHQTTHTNHFPQTTPHYQTRTITHSEQPNTQPSSTTMNWSTSGYSPKNTALTSPTSSANIQDDPVTWRTTDVSKLPVFSTIPFIHEEYSTSHISTTEGQPLTAIVQKLTPHTVYLPISTWYQHQLSTTTQHSSTMKQQASTAIYNRKPHSQVENQPVYHEEQLPGTQKTQLNVSPKTTFTKSDAIQNSPVTERVTMRTSQPGQPMASSPPKDDRVLSPPTLTNEVASMNEGRGIFRPLAQNGTQRVRLNGRVPQIPPFPPVSRNLTFNRKRVPHGEGYRGIWGSKPQKPRKLNGKTKLNQVSETKEKEKVIDLKQMDPLPDLKPLVPPTTEKPANPESVKTTTPQSVYEGIRFDTGDNSSVFSPHPLSELDAAGKNRFVGPHVIYRTDKRPEEPCSVTKSLSFFPDEEVGYLNVTGPPKTPPSNLTVVTVEGCPSFVILDWDKTDNETTEYEVVSSTKGPRGEEVSIQTTNQTHTAVENLKPESSYEFKVTPKNELGSGPTSDPVSFKTESADPRVSETPTGKNAIWSSFPFRADSYTECNGPQFIKRTWYRKFVGIQLCNSLRYKIYLSDSLKGKFYSIGDQTGYGEDHCQFVDSFLDGRTGGPLPLNQLPVRQGYFRAMRQEPVKFGEIGGNSMINYVAWYECGVPIPGKW